MRRAGWACFCPSLGRFWILLNILKCRLGSECRLEVVTCIGQSNSAFLFSELQCRQTVEVNKRHSVLVAFQLIYLHFFRTFASWTGQLCWKAWKQFFFPGFWRYSFWLALSSYLVTLKEDLLTGIQSCFWTWWAICFDYHCFRADIQRNRAVLSLGVEILNWNLF